MRMRADEAETAVYPDMRNAMVSASQGDSAHSPHIGDNSIPGGSHMLQMGNAHFGNLVTECDTRPTSGRAVNASCITNSESCNSCALRPAHPLSNAEEIQTTTGDLHRATSWLEEALRMPPASHLALHGKRQIGTTRSRLNRLCADLTNHGPRLHEEKA